MSVCSKCLQEIRARQHVITCDSCDRNQHRTCGTGVTLEAYRESRRTGVSMVYVCTACTSEEVTLMIVGAPFKKPGTRQGQLFSIHGFVEKDGDMQQFPLVFCLMSRQTTADYVRVLQAVKDRLGDSAVEGCVADFEKAEWAAVKEVFPGVEMKGCAFHWSQAVWRRVQGVGLAETYQQRTGLHNYIRRLLSLQFLPAEEIKPAFDLLKGRAMTPETQELTHYINNTWIDNNTFPPSAWSVFRQTVRTNNDVEGWHHRINAYAGGQRQQFYRIVPTLRREADLVFTNIRGGDLTRNVRQRSKTLEKQLQQLWDEYMQKTINTSGFLKKCGELYGVRV